MSRDTNRLIEGGIKNAIPKKTRRFSLDEKILTKHMTEVIPPTIRYRKVRALGKQGGFPMVTTQQQVLIHDAS